MCYCCVLQYLHLDTKNQCSILEHGGGTVLTSPVACSTKMWHNINYYMMASGHKHKLLDDGMASGHKHKLLDDGLRPQT